MFKTTSEELYFEKTIKKNRENLSAMFDKNFKDQTEILKLLVKAKNHADFNKMVSNQIFWNAAGFISMSSFDLKVIVKEMTLATDDWSKRYFARQASLLIYELSEDLFEILGKEFKKHIENLSNNTSLIGSLTNVKKSLSKFKGQHFEKLGEIRNMSSAHRHHNFLEQLKVIESINWMETLSIANEMDIIINELGSVIQSVLNRSSIELDRTN